MSRNINIVGNFNIRAADAKLAVFDFDGVFTDNTVYINEKGEETVRCFRGDGFGLTSLKNAGVKIWVISTEKNPVVIKRCKKLSVPCKTGLNNKSAALKNLARKLNVPLANVAYVGNDINDIDCLKMVGLPVVVADSDNLVKKSALFQTKKSGGFGAVREVCDWIVACKNYQKKK
ncbi:hypothetical protein A2696_02915 [Candidatus Curtissbacteria bacterium RIFCSPHIGHO2_01_FULL_41_13]|uniref:3-deoxy-D-manno-octulosonate 8-phosphate phosphatase n=1 Tax=Candidatus Curtissbacteria bacterium RIFCSPHIGHO2_01_FULL_41_13 TaxID=1797745 RepID=A0A1F5G036_9BACT|nr:MAG: hypothetical protein A2696_02915 [Candidatus Curtissbacteria bacterium RIFCSPHIGHO2_01_FULL_41_13]